MGRYLSLEELFQAVSAQTGHTYRADQRDVADYKVHAVLADLPETAFRAALQDLFNPPVASGLHQWVQNRENGATTYTFKRTGSLSARVDAVRAQALRLLRRRIELLSRWDELTPRQRATISQAEPLVAALARSQDERLGAHLVTQLPGWERLFSGAAATVGGSYSELPPGAQQSFSDFRARVLQNSSDQFRAGVTGTLTDTQINITFNADWSPSTLQWKVVFTRKGDHGIFGWLGDPKGPKRDTPLQDRVGADPIGPSGWFPALPPPPQADRAPASSVSEALKGVTVDYLYDGILWANMRFGGNYLAQARTSQALSHPLGMPISQEGALDAVGKAFGYAFKRVEAPGGPVVLGQNPRWAEEVPREVPIRLLDAWAQKKQTQGRLLLDQLAEISTLPEQQQSTLRLMFPEAGAAQSPLPRLWALLTPEERLAARSPQGVVCRKGLEGIVPAGASIRIAIALLEPLLNPGGPPIESYVCEVAATTPGGRSHRLQPLSVPRLKPGFTAEMIRR